MFRFFSSDFFNFEFLRVLTAAPFLGSETGECLEAAAEVRDGDPESWYKAWAGQAEKATALGEEAAAIGDCVGARWAFIRASNYYRSSEFFLHTNPSDPRLLRAVSKSSELFNKGMKLLDTPVHLLEIPYGKGVIPGRLFMPKKATPSPDGKIPLLIHLGGFDSTGEELYYYGPAGGVPRGYAVLNFDGPGQGLTIRRDKIPMTPAWETVTSAVIDYVEDELAGHYNLDMERLAMKGSSLGGYLVLRAAADPRVKACISCDGPYNLFDVARSRMPGWFIKGWLSGWLSDDIFNWTVGVLAKNNLQLRWEFGNGKWVFGVETPADVMRAMDTYSLKLEDGEEYLRKIKCPTLVTGARDTFYFTPEVNTYRIFEGLTGVPEGKKTLWIGEGVSGGGLQAKIGALALSHQKTFAWLDEQFGIVRDAC
ncbi:hypothetical protein MKZ38_005489 [Zalerion maritima]|uniref:Uncharacterized protein n=1 Tax=Zalerion maritima TaxID=339359 RepID=A0AAD5WW45_9PEZI|nr:hypothetical protein MKZ38_005489 [Zalerion maritima]